MTPARALVFLSVRDRYPYTVRAVAGILARAGEPVDLCVFDDRSAGADGDALWDRLYRHLVRDGRLAYLAFNTDRTTGPAPWGKAVMLAQFAKLLELPEFRGDADMVVVADNDIDFKDGWLATSRRALELAEARWPGRVALVSPVHEVLHPVRLRLELEPGFWVQVKDHQGAATWVFRPNFFARYGLPDQPFGGHGGEDAYYEDIIAARGDVLLALDEPMAFHTACGTFEKPGDSMRIKHQRRVDAAAYPYPRPGPAREKP